jgi:hypothetical protein
MRLRALPLAGYPRSVRLPFRTSLLLLVACESEKQVAADMERALSESNTALLGVLVASESLSHVYDEPDTTARHGEPLCGCPCIERVGLEPPWLLTLDYAEEGCVPETGLLPTVLSGHAVVEFDGAECQVSWGELMFALEHPVSGELGGAVSSDGRSLSPQGELTVGDQTLTLALDVRLDLESGLTLDGEVTVAHPEPRMLVFEGVHLDYQDLQPPCPTPSAGSITQVHEREKKSSVLQFSGDGLVTVERDGRVSQPTDWCGYTSELW